MIAIARATIAAAIGLLIAAAPALAHPHVWVTMKSEIVYAPDGTVTGVRHAWTFDDMFSTFAVQGLDTPAADAPKAEAPKPKAQGGFWSWIVSAWNWVVSVWDWLTGKKSESQPAAQGPAVPAAAPADDARRAFTRAQLQPLAEVNVTSLKEYDFFSHGKVNGKKIQFVEPTEYHLEYKDQLLTLHFLLPLKTPAKAERFDLEVFDPSYFVDFQLVDKDAVTLVGAPAECRLNLAKPQDLTPDMAKRLAEIPPGGAIPENTYGSQFANKISVRCP